MKRLVVAGMAVVFCAGCKPAARVRPISPTVAGAESGALLQLYRTHRLTKGAYDEGQEIIEEGLCRYLRGNR